MNNLKGRLSAALKPFHFISAKIRNKVLVMLLGLTFGTLLVAGVALFSMQLAQKTINQVVEKQGKIVELANKAQHELLLAREQDQKYLLNYKILGFRNARDEYLGNVDSHVQKTGSILKEIRQIDPDNKTIISNLAVAEKNLTNYFESFRKGVEFAETLGHKGEGMIGELRGTAQAIEDQATNFRMPELMITILTLRRHEKNFLLEGERSDLEAMREIAGRLKEQIEGSPFSEGVRRNGVYLVGLYLEKLEAVLALQRQITDNNRNYRSAINIIIPTMNTIVEVEQAGQIAALGTMNTQNRIALIVVIGASVLTLLLSVVSAFVFSNHITKQTDNIMEMFSSIGMGDFSARADILSSDELGEMAESLNAMLDNTLTLIQSRDERDAIQHSIMRLLTEISELADGDLTVRAEVTEEVTGAIADSFNSMAEQLSQVVRDVKEASLQVGRSSDDVEQVTQRLSLFSEEQAEKINEAITTIEGIAASIRQVSVSAGQFAEVSAKARNSAREGSDAVKRTNEAMASIKETMRGTARTVKRLAESSQEIGNIVQIINDIADRTSILALNASIQAAMAGDAGRGFAVVAEEVQRLAERSADSTKQIETLINTIQGEINVAGTSMEKSIQFVVDGTELADQAHSKLEEIETVSNQLADIIEKITSISQRQASDSEMITAMMQEVGVLTRKTTSATRETTASMEKITSTSRRLEESISVFKIEREAAVLN